MALLVKFRYLKGRKSKRIGIGIFMTPELYLSKMNLDMAGLAKRLALIDSDVAYVSGSLVHGLGGPNSDLDIYIITSSENFVRRRVDFDSERRNQQARRDFGIRYLNINGKELDVEYHPKDKFKRLFSALNSLDPADPQVIHATFRSLGSFERGEALELLHRFRISKPITHESEYENLKKQFDIGRFLRWAAEHELVNVGDRVKGTKRSLKEGDAENAYLKLGHLYDALADAFLFASGESLDRWKWRLPLLRRAEQDWMLKAYRMVRLAPMPETEKLPGWINDHLDRVAPMVQEIRSLFDD